MADEAVATEAVGDTVPETTPKAVDLADVGSPEGTTTSTVVEMTTVDNNAWNGAVVDEAVRLGLLVAVDGKQVESHPVAFAPTSKDGKYQTKATVDMRNRGEEPLRFIRASGKWCGKSNAGEKVSGCGEYVFRGIGRGKKADGTGSISPLAAVLPNVADTVFVDGRPFNSSEIYTEETSWELRQLILYGEGAVNFSLEDALTILAGLQPLVVGETVHANNTKGILVKKATSMAAMVRRDTAMAKALEDIGLEPLPEKDDSDPDTDVSGTTYRISL